MPAPGRHQPLSLLHHDEMVRLHVRYRLPRPIREAQLHTLRLGRVVQPEEGGQLVLAAIAGPAPNPAVPADAASGDRHLRAEALAVLPRGDRLDLQPGVLVAAAVAEEGWFAAAGGEEEVWVPVAVVVTDGEAAPEALLLEDGPEAGTDGAEPAMAVVSEGEQGLGERDPAAVEGDILVDMAVGGNDVLVPGSVEVDERRAKSQELHAQLEEPGLNGHVREPALPVLQVLRQPLGGIVADED